jgi:hypothetical protein
MDGRKNQQNSLLLMKAGAHRGIACVRQDLKQPSEK